MRFPHRWTAEGVTVLGAFTGAHLLHLSIAGCVLNDLYREAAGARIDLRWVRVSAGAGFDPHTWTSSGITYSVEVVSDVPPDELTRLLATVDEWPRSPGPCGPEPRCGGPPEHCRRTAPVPSWEDDPMENAGHETLSRACTASCSPPWTAAADDRHRARTVAGAPCGAGPAGTPA